MKRRGGEEEGEGVDAADDPDEGGGSIQCTCNGTAACEVDVALAPKAVEEEERERRT